jgi:hypothetical protein
VLFKLELAGCPCVIVEPFELLVDGGGEVGEFVGLAEEDEVLLWEAVFEVVERRLEVVSEL